MQRFYGRNHIPDLRKKSGITEYLNGYFLDLRSCFIIFTIVVVLIASIMMVAGSPNSNMPVTV